MKRKLLFSSLALLPLALWAQIISDGRFVQDGIYYRLNNETMTASVTPVMRMGSTSLTGDIVIPETITTEENKTYVVDEIKALAFNNSKITSFTCGRNIKKIGSQAFNNCRQLKSVSMDCAVVNIQGTAEEYSFQMEGLPADFFSGNTTLESITLGPAIKAIADRSFSGCTNLREVNLSDSLLVIGEYAFQNCNALTGLKFPESLMLIRFRAFDNAGLTSVSIHPKHGRFSSEEGGRNYKDMLHNEVFDEYTDCEILPLAFDGCKDLDSISLGDNITVTHEAFRHTKWYEAQPEGLLYIDNILVDFKFAGMDVPKSFEVKEGTRRVSGEVFSSNSGLSSRLPVDVTFPESLEIIDYKTFYGAYKGPKDITIPANVKALSFMSFAGTSFNHVFMQPVTPPSNNNSGIREPAILYVPSVSLAAYQDAWENYPDFLIRPMDGIDAATGIIYALNEADGTATISEASGTDLNIPSAITHEGKTYPVTALATNSITAWGRLTLPETLKTICSGAISFPSDANGAEEYVPGSVIIPASVDSIDQRPINNAGFISVAEGNPVFDSREDCNAIIHTATNTLVIAGMENPRIPASVKAIGPYAFTGNKHLKNLQLPECLTTVGTAAFAACDSITTLHIPASVSSIGRWAFSGCKWLTNITVDPQNPIYESIEGFPAIIEKATKTLVQGCAIQPYTDGEGNTQYNQTLVIPNGIKRIDDYAFGLYEFLSNDVNYSPAMQLRTVILPPSCSSVGSSAFTACKGLQDLTVRTKESLRTETVMDDGSVWPNVSELFNSDISSRVYINVPVGTLALYDGSRASELVSGRVREYYCNDNYSFNDADMTATVIKGWVDADSCFSVPATAKGYYEGEEYTVTEIGKRAASTRSERLGLDTNVTRAVLPATVRRINTYAFNRCSALTSINLPEGLEYIGAYAFSGCSALEGLSLPASVNHVGYQAFYNVPITEEEENGLRYFGTILYSNTRQTLQDTIIIREGTTVIADLQFGSPSSAQQRKKYTIELPQSLKGIAVGAFSSSRTYTITANVVSRAKEAPIAEYNEENTSITWEHNFVNIDTLYVPAGSKESYMTQGYLGEGGIFHQTWQARTVIEKGGYTTDEGIHYALNDDGTATLTGVDTTYHAALVIPETLNVDGVTYTVTAIGAYALDSCSLESVTIPATVEHIGQGAFQGVEVSSMELPETATEVAPLAFAGSNIQSITLPESITSIGESAFRDCANLRYVILPDSVETIGDYAFKGLGTNVGAGEAGQASTRRKAREVNPEDDLLAGKTFVTLPEATKFIGANALADVDVVESFIREPEKVQSGGRVCPVINGICRVPFRLAAHYGDARWSAAQFVERDPESFTLVFILDGEVYSEQTLLEGEQIGSLPVPEEREGLTFTGWTTDAGEEADENMQMPYGGLTLYGSYSNGDGVNGISGGTATAVSIYSADGRRLSGIARGINILRMADGTTRKIFVK